MLEMYRTELETNVTEKTAKYEKGNWINMISPTEEEINELKNQNLYMINKEKVVGNGTFNLNDSNNGLNFTFGGFTYDGDTANASDIAIGNIITSRNQSVTPQSGYGTPEYSGWQILESKEENGKIYVTKIIHAGSPENFVYYYATSYDNRRVEYILSGGKRQTEYSTLSSGKAINSRSWQMYVDKKQIDLIANTTDKEGNQIKDIHAMDYSEAYSTTNSTSSTKEIRNTGAYYWLASAYTRYYSGYYQNCLWYVQNNGTIYSNNDYDHCWGIRLVVSIADGVYIASGSGTDADPYILGKD